MNEFDNKWKTNRYHKLLFKFFEFSKCIHILMFLITRELNIFQLSINTSNIQCIITLILMHRQQNCY